MTWCIGKNRLRRADGEYRSVLDNGSLVPKANFAGNRLCIDITEQKRLKRNSSNQAQLWTRSSRDHGEMGSWTLQPVNRVEWSDEWYRIFGLPRD